MTRKLLVVNLFSGPGGGKSTLAADVFVDLKKAHCNVELVTEYAKSVTWRGDLTTYNDQIYLFGKQHHSQFILEGQCDVAITDSPILLPCIYNAIYSKYNHLDPIALEAFHRFENLSYLLERSFRYDSHGRNQTEEESQRIDRSIVKFLDLNEIPYSRVLVQEAKATIVRDILTRLELQKAQELKV